MSQIPPSMPPGQPLQYASPTLTHYDLKKVASQQRAIMLCILTELLVFALLMVTASQHIIVLAGALYFIYVAVGITAAVYIFMLAISLYNTGVGVVLGILTLIPLIGLIVLLIVNQKATTTLRSHGIKVGLLGANPATVPLDPRR